MDRDIEAEQRAIQEVVARNILKAQGFGMVSNYPETDLADFYVKMYRFEMFSDLITIDQYSEKMDHLALFIGSEREIGEKTK